MRIPLYRGEFGLEVRFQVPVVAAMGDVEVEIEAGKEALYPFARHVVHERTPETTAEASRERGKQGRPPLSGPERRFIPRPHIAQGVGDVDIVVCPRWRHYVAEKNWKRWPWLVDELADMGFKVFAGGVADASDTRVQCDAAWNYERPLDATIEALNKAQLVIGMCSGLCHLAVLCGAPLLVLTYRGLDAPGPVIDSSGTLVRTERWKVRMDEYYHAANHTGSPIDSLDAWEHPERVLDYVRKL